MVYSGISRFPDFEGLLENSRMYRVKCLLSVEKGRIHICVGGSGLVQLLFKSSTLYARAILVTTPVQYISRGSRVCFNHQTDRSM